MYTTSVTMTLKTVVFKSGFLEKQAFIFVHPVLYCVYLLLVHAWVLSWHVHYQQVNETKNSRSSDIFATKNCCVPQPSLIAWLALLIYSCFQDSIIFRMFLKFRNICFMSYMQFHDVSSNVAANSGRNPGPSPLTGKGTCLVGTTTSNT